MAALERLAVLEEEVGAGLRDFVDVGNALREIRDSRLYKQQGYKSFEIYCQERWGWDRRNANRHIEASDIAIKLGSIDPSTGIWNPGVQNVGQARAIRPLAREDVGEAREMMRDLQKAHGSDLTAARIEEMVKAQMAREQNKARWQQRLASRRASLVRRAEEAANSISSSSELPWYHGDCLELLPKLHNQLVGAKPRLALIDVPYGEGKNDCANDKSIETALSVVEPTLRSLRSVLAEDAHLLLFANEWCLRQMLFAVEKADFRRQRLLVWDKMSPGPGNDGLSWRDGCEYVIHATRGQPAADLHGEHPVLDYARVPPVQRDHSCEKPVALLEYLIRKTTVEREMVIDCFGGVGTTVVAAINLNRQFWGCEFFEQHYEVGRARIKEALAAREGEAA